MSEPPEDSGLRCLECDYNLTGLHGSRCPECGWLLDKELLAFALSDEPPGAQRSLLAILAGFVGLTIVGVCLAVGIGELRNASVVKLAPTAPFTMLVVMCGSLHIAVAACSVWSARTWPMYRPRLLGMCRICGVVQVVATVVYLFTLNPTAIRGAVEFVIMFAFWSAPGTTLLVVAAIALTNKHHSVRHLRAKLARQPTPAPVGAPFRVEAGGRYPPEKVHVAFERAKRETNPTVERLIDSTWQAKVQEAKDKNQTLHNGPLGRLIGAATNGDALALVTGETDYRDFVGTNLYNAELIARFGQSCFADPLGTSATVITSEGYLLYGRRNQRVLFHAGCLHTFGGLLESEDRTADGSYDVFSAIRRELREELHLHDREISETVCTGLVRDHAIRQPELLFDVHVTASRGELESRFVAETDEEHQGLEVCHDLPEAIVPFVKRSEPITPVAIAALMLHGRTCWGLDWYESTAYALFGDLPLQRPIAQCEKRGQDPL